MLVFQSEPVYQISLAGKSARYVIVLFGVFNQRGGDDPGLLAYLTTELMLLQQPGGQELGDGVLQRAGIGGHAYVGHRRGGQNGAAMVGSDAA